MPLKDYIQGKTNRIVVGSAAAIGLIIALEAGISALTPATQVHDDNGQNMWGVNFRGQSTQSGFIASKNLLSCNTIDSTSTGMLICGTDATGGGGGSTGTGSLQTAFDKRYVAVQGDTMTGGLLIHSTNDVTKTVDAGILLEVGGVASGRILHAQDQLRSSGTLVVEGAVSIAQGALTDSSIVSADVNDGTLTADDLGADSVASSELNATDVEAELEAVLDHDDLQGFVANEHIDHSAVLILAGQGLTGGGDLTASRVVRLAAAFSGTTVEFTVLGSGTDIFANRSLRSSGTLAVEGAATIHGALSGNTILGFNLSDCDADNQTVSWDATTNTFGCGDDDNTGSAAAGQGITVNGSVISLTAAHSGTTIEGTTLLSGAIVHAQNELRSSGTLVVEGNATIAGNLTAGDLICSSAGCIDATALGTDSVSADELNATGVEAELEAVLDHNELQGYVANEHVNHASVLILAGQGLTGGGDLTASRVVRLAAAFSGTTVEFTTLGSGADIYGKNSLRSSGTLAVEGSSSLHGTLSGNTITGFNLTDCDLDTQSLAWDSTNSRFECGDDDGAPPVAGQGITVSGQTVTLSAAHSGTTIEAVTLMSGAWVHGQNRLSSSGSIANEGGYWQDGFTDCDGATAKALWNITDGKWSCGTDDDVPESGDFAAAGDLDADGTITDGVIDKADLSVSTDFGEISTDGSSNLTIDADVIGQSEVTGNTLDFAEFQDGLDVDANTTITLGANGLQILATSTGQFEIIGTASGRQLHAQDQLRSSGTLTVEGAAKIHGTLSGNTIEGFNLTDCDLDTQTLSWDATTKTLGCGDDDNSGGSGISYADAASYFVDDSGDTMTGALVILVTGGNRNTVAIESPHLLSGSNLYASDALRSSGSLVVEGVSSFNNNANVLFSSGVTFISAKVSGAATEQSLSIKDPHNVTALSFNPEINASRTRRLNVFNPAGNTVLDFSSSPTSTSFNLNTPSGAIAWDFALSDSNVTYVFNDPAESVLFSVAGDTTENTFVINDPGSNFIFDTSGTDSTHVTSFGDPAGTAILQTTLTATDTDFLFKGPGGTSAFSLDFGASSNILTLRDEGEAVFLQATADAGAGLLEIIGVSSGRVVHAQDQLRSSGTLVVEKFARIPRHINFPLCDGQTACGTGTGASVRIGPEMDNYILSGAWLSAAYAGTTSTMSVQLREITDSHNMFTTAYTLDSGERDSDTAATPGVVSANVLDKGDILVPVVTAVHTTPAKGASLLIYVIPK